MRRSGLVPVLALVLAAMSLVLGGCLGDDDDETTTTATTGGDLGLITEGTLTVGSDIPFPPFEQGKAPDYKGYDIDVVNEVAKRLGLEVKYEDTAFDTIFRDLAQGKFDMVASATTITESREERVDFSDPYYEAQQALAVEPGSDIKTTADLGGKTVGAQDGTTGETYAKDETDAKNVRGFPEAADALNALRGGQVDAVILDEPVVKDAIEKGEGGIEIAEVIKTDELYGLAVQQDSDTLRERVNEVLVEMKGDGTLTGFYEKWFPGTEPTESVLKGTNDQLK
jgi:polar amino acid transport system substrate-binding protein